MSDSTFSVEALQMRTYRDLQKLAKSLSLPSNVKKVYLVQLIHAKKNKTAAEVSDIVQRVKFERQQMSQLRKKTKNRRSHLQNTEVSSTSSSQSPPICNTPKRRHFIQYSPVIQDLVVKYTQPRMLRPYIKKVYTSPNPNHVKPSDRVLRSFGMKTRKSFKDILDTERDERSPSPNECVSPTQSQMYTDTFSHQVDEANYNKHIVVNKHRPNIIQSNKTSIIQRQRIPFMNKMIVYPNPAKRQRLLSGIYPIATKENQRATSEDIQSVGFRRSDGRITKINAVIKKQPKVQPQKICNVVVTVQDLINSNVESFNSANIQDNINSLQYPNMSSVTEPDPNDRIDSKQVVTSYEQCTVDQHHSEYYHKIRSEQVRCQTRENLQLFELSPQDVRCNQAAQVVRCDQTALPKIFNVFSKFSDVRGMDVTQPIYVQVSTESERMLNYPAFMMKPNTSSTTMLECLYNFKTEFLVSQPLLQIATTTSTRCVYSTPVISTPMAYTTTVVCNDTCTALSCEQDSGHHDYIQTTYQNITGRNFMDETEDFSTESSFDQSSQTATIPEMVEDALEIISQDGDYMERIGMEERIDCIICPWAGPRSILEYHIRKEHVPKIWHLQNGCYSAAVSLGAILRGQALRRVLAQPQALYLLRAGLCSGDILVADLVVLTTELSPKTGQITVNNKVTGAPHTWCGEILLLSPDLPYYNDTNCFKLPITSLNLLPGNVTVADMKEIVESSEEGYKVVPDLDDINIVFYVKVFA